MFEFVVLNFRYHFSALVPTHVPDLLDAPIKMYVAKLKMNLLVLLRSRKYESLRRVPEGGDWYPKM